MTEDKAVFLLSKDPETDHGGDVRIAKQLVALAREVLPVRMICLSRGEGLPSTPDLIRVPKPVIRHTELVWHSVRSRRSLIHTRFDTPALRELIAAADDPLFVSDHSYMAESWLASNRSQSSRLVVMTGVSEAEIWRSTRGGLLKFETPRIERDELRVARAASIVATFDTDEATRYRTAGIRDVRWIDVTLAPQSKLDLSTSRPRLVFMGSRQWLPNVEALDLLLDRWPAIAQGIPGAELSIIGPGTLRARRVPTGVVDRGFVPDLGAFLQTCRALVAPIVTGGGVRVKMLEAASHGLPVIGSSAALGSHGAVLGLSAFDDAEQFIERCRRLLLDRRAAIEAGDAIYRANVERWHARAPHRAVERLLIKTGGNASAMGDQGGPASGGDQ